MTKSREANAPPCSPSDSHGPCAYIDIPCISQHIHMHVLIRIPCVSLHLCIPRGVTSSKKWEGPKKTFFAGDQYKVTIYMQCHTLYPTHISTKKLFNGFAQRVLSLSGGGWVRIHPSPVAMPLCIPCVCFPVFPLLMRIHCVSPAPVTFPQNDRAHCGTLHLSGLWHDTI